MKCGICCRMAAKRLIRPTYCGCGFCCRMAAKRLIRPTYCGCGFCCRMAANRLIRPTSCGFCFCCRMAAKRFIRPTNCGFCFCCRMRRKRLIRPDGPAFVGLISAAPSGNSQNPASERINASARRSALHAYLPASLSPRAGYRRQGYRSSYSYDRR